MKSISIAIIGGGRGGSSFLKLFLESSNIHINCVIDTDPASPGMQIAVENNIQTYSHVSELRKLKGIDLIVNVTGDRVLSDIIERFKPEGSNVIDGEVSNLIYQILLNSFSLSKEVEKTEKYMEQVFANSRDMIITTNKERKIVRFNKGGEEILGYTEKEVIGKDITDFYADRSDRHIAIAALKKDGYISNFETRLRAKDDRVVDISLTLTALFDEGNEFMGTVGVSKDITEQKENARIIHEKNEQLQEFSSNLEKTILKRTEDLEKANEQLTVINKYKTQFIANMSHELRTPLNSVIGFSEILIDGTFGELNPKQQKYSENINRSGQHLLQIINDILDLAKIDSGKMEIHKGEFELNETLKTSMYMFEGIAAKQRVNLHFDLCDEQVYVNADTGKIKQALFNLMSNAIKFTPEEGNVTLKTTCQDTYVKVDIIDTGIGIPKKDHEKVFMEFEQVDNSYSREFEGTGLGLPLVRRFLQMHDSDITLESEEGKGSTFSFVLDLISLNDKKAEKERYKRELEEEENQMRKVPTISNETPLILVVEDDPEAMEIISLFLIKEGLRTAHAYDGEEAIRKAIDLKPAAITLDIMLPKVDGWEVIQTLKNNPETSRIPIIITSMTDNKELGFSLGAVDFLTKPLEKDRLRTLLNDIVENHYDEKKEVSVLAVDDKEENLVLIKDILFQLEGLNLTVDTASGGMDALKSVGEKIPDLIILDLMMPEVTGFDVIKNLKGNAETAQIPIVILTAMNLTSDDKVFLEKETEKIFMKSEMTIQNFLNDVKKVIGRNNTSVE